ncbi:hypothetical protein ACG02S_09985 [Roseateles sp. DC23W]|uniref:Uncharacterized protein n=1 Tax=Pelomonas dachongensis TaxID=3299029 RepID=A0ABW7ENE7_9BURK
MDKKEIQAEVTRRLAQENSKTSTFKALKGKGVRDAVLANMIASYAEPARVEAHTLAVKILVGISWLQLVLAVMVVLMLGVSFGWLMALVLTAATGAFCYLFVWGFKNHKAGVYNAWLFLTVINFHRHFKDFAEAPTMNTILLLLNIGLLGFIFYLRSKLFPDMVLVGPMKVRGEYRFSS